MHIEYEATFENVDKDEIRSRLKKAGAKLVRPEFSFRRVTLHLPTGHEIPNAWLRVRDNGKKITQTLKIVSKGKIENQQELEITVDSFENTIEFLEKIGCRKKAFQETKREKWELDSVEVCIDEWPFLEPFIEVEGENEEDVRKVSEKLGFEWDRALFCAVGHLYERKYGISEEHFNDRIPKIVFDMENPFAVFSK
jgi:adenylate cyclase, class 2